MTCDVCQGAMSPALTAWTFHCPRCGLWQSTLRPAIERREHPLSEADRRKALEPLRLANANRILDRLACLTPLERLRLLDVGCAYGWFLEAAASRGIAAVGIEPDAGIARAARSRDLPVRLGYFPDCLSPGDLFDVVVFNDTLEHLPRLHDTAAACARTIVPGGFLVLSVPTSAGSLFRLARAAAGLGWLGPWRRLWQESFPSPHLYYFNRSNLDAALGVHGFRRADAQETDVFHPAQLWARLKLDRRSSIAVNVVLYLLLLAAYPFYRTVGRADTELLIYRHDSMGRGVAPVRP